jgi:hypothetical protein
MAGLSSFKGCGSDLLFCVGRTRVLRVFAAHFLRRATLGSNIVVLQQRLRGLRGGIVGVVNRINSDRAVWHDSPTLIIFAGISRQNRRSSAEDEGRRESERSFIQHFRISIV